MTENYMDLTAPIFNIQSFSVHDGPGIRVTVFEKGCPLRCLWCANPESNEARPQLMTYDVKCIGCGTCVQTCPQKAVTLIEKDGKPCQFTDRTKCVDCGACVPFCYAQARELAGEKKTVREVLERVLRERIFLEDSGGGITISGGECLMHPDFTEALLYAAKQEGLHTAVESCSFASRAVVDQVFRYVDLGLLDVKHMDSAKHKEYTGVPNEQILDNIRHIHCDLGVAVTIRTPTIPGYNDSEENIAATARFARSLGEDVALHLLPYHRLGESKNQSLGRSSEMGIEPPDDAHMQHLKEIAEQYVSYVQIGG